MTTTSETAPAPKSESIHNVLWRYLAFSYLFIVLHYAFFLSHVKFKGASVALFAVVVALTGPLWLMAPVFLPSAALSFVKAQGARSAALAWAVLSLAMVHIFIYLDRFVFNLYGFHFNGFVWNLITTPGGIESMGAEGGTQASMVLLCLGFVAFQTGLMVATMKVGRIREFSPKVFRKRTAWIALAVVLVLVGFEKLSYGWSRARFRTPLLAAADAFPFYVRCDLTRPAKWLGVKPPKNAPEVVPIDDETLHVQYPLSPIRRDASKPKLNVIWLVSESWRWDMLDPEIMPATHAFAKESTWFRGHYSGGNGTRTGMFSMFYGLHGPYWFPFLAENRGPVLIDLIQKEGYETKMFTSANFQYPEFNRTIFARIPPEKLVESPVIARWERDRQSVGKVIDFLKEQKPDRPFMTFLFFESPHANYEFPDECAIRKPYADHFNYLTIDFAKMMPQIKNRYFNSCRHLDTQVDRLVKAMKELKLLDNSIVILTGDHGEEFMEKGRWGHNSTFVDEQTRVPLVLHVPGRAPEEIQRMTSHLDLPATVMKLLGVENPPEDFSLGFDLFGPTARPFTVLSDWDNVCYVGGAHKAVFSLKNYRFQPNVTTREDGPVSDPAGVILQNRDWLFGILKDLRRFRR